MGIIGTIIIGFIVGLAARFIKPGDDKMGFWLTAFVGIVGAFVGTYLGQAFGIYHMDEPAGFFGAMLGAIIVLALAKAFGKRRSVLS
ncbi:MAG: transglycosylase [Bdellovibrio sp. 28-41-41]|nr:MAG: transglycosylase [Bdellovibrio sp. 28-41-41]